MAKCRDEDESPYQRVKRRENIKSKWQMSERRRDAATVHKKTVQAKCIRGHKTQKHCQHASSVEANR